MIHEDVKVKQEEVVTTNHVSQHEDSKNKTYLQDVNVYISNGQTSIPTAALLDSRSDSNLISGDLADKVKDTLMQILKSANIFAFT